MSTRSRQGDLSALVDPLLIAWGLIIALGVALLLYLSSVVNGSAYGPAFATLHASATALATGESPYLGGFTANPLLPLLFLPFASLPLVFAYLGAGFLTITTWTIASFLLVREAGVRDRGTARMIGLAAALLPWFFAPAAETLIAGSPLLLAGLSLAGLLLALDARRGFTAGLLLALTAVLHPAALLVALFLAGRRDLRTLAYAAAVGALLVAGSTLISGMSGAYADFPSQLFAWVSAPVSPLDRSLAGELLGAGLVDPGSASLLRIALLAAGSVVVILLGAGSPLWLGGPLTLLVALLALPGGGAAAGTLLLPTALLLLLWTPMPGLLDRLLRPASYVFLLVAAYCAALAAAGGGPWFWAALAAPYLLATLVARSPRTA